MSNVYFLTHKMFRLPSYDNYYKALDKFLKGVYPNRPLSNKARWEHICKLFSKYIEPSYQARFATFVESRENVQAGRTNLSLEDATVFIENFYFLLETADPRFKLERHQKNKILDLLKEIYSSGLCEPGVVTRLNDTLLEYRNDGSWIAFELSKYRYNMIRMMDYDYNHIHRVPDSFSSHTLMQLSKLAVAENLGISPESMIDDAYMNSDSVASITAYFKANIHKKLKSYEKDFIDGLMTELWSVFVKDYAPQFTINASRNVVFEDAFENGKIKKCHNSEVFDKFLSAYFGEGVSRAEFYEELDDYENVYQLVDEENLKKAFKKALLEKLELEGFIIPFEKINEENIENIRLICENQTIEEQTKQFLLLFASKKGDISEDIKTFLSNQHSNQFNYPRVLASILMINMDIWEYLPYAIKNNIDFIQQLILMHGQESNTRFFVIAEEILKINPEFLSYFSDSQKELLRAKFNLMSFDEVRQYYADAKLNIAILKPIDGILPRHIKPIWHKKQLSIDELASHISLFTPRQLLDYLKNHDIKVEGICLKALEQFDQGLKHHNKEYEKIWLKRGYLGFKTQIQQVELSDDLPKIYTLDFYKHQAQKSINRHCNWLDALRDFQQNIPESSIAFSHINSFKTYLKFLLELGIQACKTIYQFGVKLSDVLIKASIALLMVCITTYINLFVLYVLDNIYTLGFLVFALIALAQIIRNFLQLSNLSMDKKIYFFCQIISLALFPFDPIMFVVFSGVGLLREILVNVFYWISKLGSQQYTLDELDLIVVNIINYNVTSIQNLGVTSFNFLKFIYQEILTNFPLILLSAFQSTFLRVYHTLSQKFNSDPNNQSAHQRIEANIWRLESIDDVSAHQKAKILRQIWHAIGQEKDIDLNQALDKSYPISFKGKDYCLSFNQVSALKRTVGEEICLDDKPTKNFFFSSTSKKVLDDLSIKAKSLKVAC
jgi:hypothetical protein